MAANVSVETRSVQNLLKSLITSAKSCYVQGITKNGVRRVTGCWFILGKWVFWRLGVWVHIELVGVHYLRSSCHLD